MAFRIVTVSCHGERERYLTDLEDLVSRANLTMTRCPLVIILHLTAMVESEVTACRSQKTDQTA